MEAKDPEVAAFLRKFAGFYTSITKRPSRSPPSTDDPYALFVDLDRACCTTPINVDVSTLPQEMQAMREELIRLRADAVGQLEAHYSDMLAAFDNPVDHLHLYPQYSKYLTIAKMEHELLERHIPGFAPARVAFIGSGPLPFSSLLLASRRHFPDTLFDNYDRCDAANVLARKLVRADEDLSARMSFHTADAADLKHELRAYDVVFLASFVGLTTTEKTKVIANLGKNMADGAVLVARGAHGARGLLVPLVDLEDIRRAGFDVLAKRPPDHEVINSMIIARKVGTRANRQNGHEHAIV